MKGSTVTIRRAVPEDASAIADVHVASWRTTYPGIVDQAYIDGLSVDVRTVTWARRLEESEASASDILVATDTARGIVGFASGGLLREPMAEFDGELHAIYLLASVQRAGVGRRLVREWAVRAVGRGLRAAIVRVLTANPARAFYERLGAERLQDAELVIGGKTYPERWYGWRNLLDLTA